MTYRELVYMALDALKIHSDDSKFTEDHVIFLLNKYRAYALQQKYSKTLEGVNNANYQTIPIEFGVRPPYYKSNDKIPSIINIKIPEVFVKNNEFSQNPIVFTSEDRFRYVGNNRFLNNIVYCTIGSDSYLYLKTVDPMYKSCYLTAVFEDAVLAERFDGYTGPIMDREFPMEDTLVPSVLELVLKDLTNGIYKPSDNTNDAQDALSDLAGYLRRNMKSQFQKNIDE